MRVLQTVYEDDDLIVIDKPAGLAVQGGERVISSVDDILAAQLGYRPFLVHRLDKGTSGLLMVAKNKVAAALYSRLIQGGDIRKIYLALCSSHPANPTGIIEEPLRQRGEMRDALTEYRILASSASYSLIQLRLGTGRMHQIRMHLSGIACPILGDDKYGDFPLNKRLRKERAVRRLMLHAWSLSFPIPSKSGAVRTELRTLLSDIPDCFQPFMQELGLDPRSVNPDSGPASMPT
jgi:23S rRNA pseudouridine955/2504/2580 synthase